MRQWCDDDDEMKRFKCITKIKIKEKNQTRIELNSSSSFSHGLNLIEQCDKHSNIALILYVLLSLELDLIPLIPTTVFL